MKIREVLVGKREYLPLLLVGDEQENMIDRYLDRGRLFILEENDLKAVAVVTDEGSGSCEVKNLAVAPAFQGRGYGTVLMQWLIKLFSGQYYTMRLGTGENLATLRFYRRLGFVETHRVKNFFVEHYDHPIVENGVRLTDMIYLERRLGAGDETE